jgi:hypothetical protein
MTTVQLHARPSLSAVVSEQIRTVCLQLRLLSAFLLGAFLLYAAVAVRVASNIRNANEAHHGHAIVDLSFTPEISIVIVVLALMVPSVMWNGEDPTRRSYHLSMPIGRAAHAWIRTFAGWLWTIGAAAVFVITVAAVDALCIHIMGDRAPTDPNFRNWEWAVPFTAITVAYILASAAAVGARTPAVWIVGPFALYSGATLLMGGLGYTKVAAAMMKVISGYYGLETAIAGVVGGSSHPGIALHADVGRWIGATALWGAAGLLLLYLLARRRPG